MTTTALEKATDQIADTMEKASRISTKMGDTLQDKFDSARRAAKKGTHAAEELLDETKQQIKRRPIGFIGATFFIGMLAGAVIGWTARRK
jgi:ElaB/YqjD/DUF883 family membrane-anchored ribosome-binding protein